ncbi:MAG: DUF2334 domain-containing protein [Lachnospiraceae bacterium]|nr:DUF2334 domain-containing protein [Lachnospiraceae bacterium]
MMKFTIRMDDITPGMNRTNFERFRHLLEAHDIRPLIGVVPECRDPLLQTGPPDPSFWESVHALQQSGWQVAMHGLYHIYTTKKGGLFPLNRDSEFAGLPLERQRKMIAKGKKLLSSHGVETDLFMAPSHSYDRATLQALRENGFQYVTDGFGTAPYEYDGLTFFPIAARKQDVLEKSAGGLTTLVVHTNTMTEEGFRFYEKLLKTGRGVSYDAWYGEEKKQQTHAGRAKEYLTAIAKRFAVRIMTRVKK